MTTRTSDACHHDGDGDDEEDEGEGDRHAACDSDGGYELPLFC